jgi:esterase
MQLALNHPRKVGKLIVADMSPRAYAPRHVEILDALSALDLSKYDNRTDLENILAPAIPELPLRRFLLKNVTRDPAGAFYWRMNLSGLQANYRHLIESLPADKTFDEPTLFIRGEKSDYVLESDLPLIRHLFPQAEIHTLPNAGHWLHADSPSEFVKVVSEFLQRS